MTTTRKHLRITITGETYDDVLLSLDTVRDYIANGGYKDTYGSFDESNYKYQITEEEFIDDENDA